MGIRIYMICSQFSFVYGVLQYLDDFLSSTNVQTVTSLWVLMCKTVVFIERGAIEQLNTIIISSLGDVDFIRFYIGVSIKGGNYPK